MTKEIKAARLATGEIFVFENIEADEGTVLMQNPFVLVGSQQGPVLMPVMPWAAKGTDYRISLRATDIMFYFPDEHCEPMRQSYIAQTSSLDLSGIAGVHSISPRQR